MDTWGWRWCPVHRPPASASSEVSACDVAVLLLGGTWRPVLSFALPLWLLFQIHLPSLYPCPGHLLSTAGGCWKKSLTLSYIPFWFSWGSANLTRLWLFCSHMCSICRLSETGHTVVGIKQFWQFLFSFDRIHKLPIITQRYSSNHVLLLAPRCNIHLRWIFISFVSERQLCVW